MGLANRLERVTRRHPSSLMGALRPELAARLETIPGGQISSLSHEEKEEVTDLDRKLQRYLDAPRGRSPHR